MKIRTHIAFFLFCFTPFFATAAISQENYPHWDLKKPENVAVLQKIDQLIQGNKGKSAVALFDWDGTVYDETIRSKEISGSAQMKSSQAVWHVWAAHHATHPAYRKLNLFPHYRDCAKSCVLNGLLLKNDYLEGFTPDQPALDDYSKFSQIAGLTAGMTPVAYAQGVHAYEKKYPVSRFAFLPMFDVIQQMINHGFKVWFVSGSNPHFIAQLLKKIEKINPNYDFSSIIEPTRWSDSSYPTSNRIIGNQAKLFNGKFTRIYDEQYINRQANEPLQTITGKGKAMAIQRFIAKRDKGPIIFAAGNSAGDIEMMEEVSKNNPHLLLAINAERGLAQFIQHQPKALSIWLAEDQE